MFTGVLNAQGRRYEGNPPTSLRSLESCPPSDGVVGWN